MERRPGRLRAPSAPIRQPGCRQVLRTALGRGGQHGRAEVSPGARFAAMRRVYDIAAEMQVPVMMHIQNFPHFQGELPYNTGYTAVRQDSAGLPADDFHRARRPVLGPHQRRCSHRSRLSGRAHQAGRIDRTAGSPIFPNLYADMSANSGNNALSRDPDSPRDFIARHRGKLIFGSDCSCTDGKGGRLAGQQSGGRPPGGQVRGARDAWLLKRLATPEIFRKMVWENANQLFKVRFS